MSITSRTLKSGKTVWDVRVRVESRYAGGDRKPITRTVHGTFAEAKRVEARLIVEAEGGGVRDAKRTVEDLMRAWLDDAGAGTWAVTTAYRRLKDTEQYILPAIGGVKLDRLTARHLDTLYKSMRDKGLSGRTVGKVHAHIRAALRRGVKWGWLPAAVTERATPGPARGNPGRVASLAEIEALLAAADPELRLAIRLAATTGARRSELCGLEWGDVNFDAGTISIRRALVMVAGKPVMSGTKTHAARTLQMDAETMALLKGNRGIGGPILGASPDTMSKRLAALCDRLGIEHLGWHAFRHYVGTTLIGVTDVKTGADRMGHSTPTTFLNHYVHAMEARSKDAADALGKALGS